jgi:hypothetical protein
MSDMLTFPAYGKNSGGDYVYHVELDGEVIGRISASYAGNTSRRVGWTYYLHATRYGLPSVHSRLQAESPYATPELAARAVADRIAPYYWSKKP